MSTTPDEARIPCCPSCKTPMPLALLREWRAAANGAAGRGASKARDPEKMRAAALKRWGKR